MKCTNCDTSAEFGWSRADYQIWQSDERSGKPVSTSTANTDPWPVNPSVACRSGQTRGNLTWQDLGPDADISDWACTRLICWGDTGLQLVGMDGVVPTWVSTELRS